MDLQDRGDKYNVKRTNGPGNKFSTFKVFGSEGVHVNLAVFGMFTFQVTGEIILSLLPKYPKVQRYMKCISRFYLIKTLYVHVCAIQE